MTYPSLLPPGFQIVSAGLAIFSILAGVHSQPPPGHPLQVDTPGPLAECQTAKLSWGSGQAPFTLNIHFQTNDSLFHGFGNLTGTSMLWQANIPAGNMLYLELLDSSNNRTQGFSGHFSIQTGDDSCLQSSNTSSSSSSSSSTITTTSDATSAGGTPQSTSPLVTSPTTLPDPVVASPSSNLSAHALSTGGIAGIAVACLFAGLLIALVVWLIRRRNNTSSSPRIPVQRQLDSYSYPKPLSDDGWSVTTPRDPEDEPRSHPEGYKATVPTSWDPKLFVREKTRSPSPPPPIPMYQPPVPRQDTHPGTIPRPLSSYPALIPIPTGTPTPSPSPVPMPVRESGMWGDSESSLAAPGGASLSRSSTNPFRARMLAAAATSGTSTAQGQAGAHADGSNW